MSEVQETVKDIICPTHLTVHTLGKSPNLRQKEIIFLLTSIGISFLELKWTLAVETIQQQLLY